MASVMVTKCKGCNAILRARESCARCASAARARLHAAGVCRKDGTGQPYDNGTLGIRLTGEWLDELLSIDQHIHEWGGGINSVTRGTPEPARNEPLPKSGPALGERRAWLNPPTYYRRPLDKLNDAVRSGELVLRERELAQAVDHLSKLAYQHEPPPVGGAVDWETAKRDMMARSAARYELYPGSEYRWCAERQMLMLGVAQSRNTEAQNESVRWTRLA